MRILKTTAFAAIVGASALAFTVTNASARIVCNDEGDYWHQREAFDYPAGVGVVIHPDDWKWKEGEKHSWREHEGRGYWRGGIWIGIP